MDSIMTHTIFRGSANHTGVRAHLVHVRSWEGIEGINPKPERVIRLKLRKHRRQLEKCKTLLNALEAIQK